MVYGELFACRSGFRPCFFIDCSPYSNRAHYLSFGIGMTMIHTFQARIPLESLATSILVF